MEYLLKASGIVVILFLFYELFLKKETFFSSIRAYFIIGLLFVISVPLLEIPVYVKTAATTLNTLSLQEIPSTQVIQENFDWLQLFGIIYLIGVMFFSIKFIIQLTSLLLFISKHKRFKNGSYFFIETTKNCSPFSFFNIIIFNKSQFSEEEFIQVLNHEKAHAQQWHSLDTLLAHLLVITLWFNPFVWLYKKALLQNLEFLADAKALKLANNQQIYQITLLKTCSTNYCAEITNNFYNSLIKKRIIMLHKSKSTNKKQFKYILLLPILIGFIFTFNTKIVAQETTSTQENKISVELVIDKNSTDENLAKESSFFQTEMGITLTFNGIKRNSSNEIIAIKINAKGENIKANYKNSRTEPIDPVIIAYNSTNNSLIIGSVSENIQEKNNLQFIGSDDASGTTFIITDANGKIEQQKEKEVIVLNSGNKNEKPLVILDEKEVSYEEMEEINPETFKSIDVLKGEHAIKNYGDKGENGVLIITSNEEKSTWNSKTTDSIKKVEKLIINGNEVNIYKNNDAFYEVTDTSVENVTIIKNENGKIKQQKEEKGIVFNSGNKNEKPLVLVDGKEISKEEMENIDPDNIESLSVLKGDKATKKYGEKAINGVIEIILKK